MYHIVDKIHGMIDWILFNMETSVSHGMKVYTVRIHISMENLQHVVVALVNDNCSPGEATVVVVCVLSEQKFGNIVAEAPLITCNIFSEI